MEAVLGLVAYSFVAAVTPGPNNVVLWGIGLRHGFRAAVPYLLGIPLGVGLMVLAVAAFRPPDLSPLAGALLMAGVVMVVVLPSAGVWAGAGGALSRFVSGPRAHRAVNLALAIVLAGMVVLIWV